ncbi:MAG TPA: FAD-dependent monooxygenase [Stellaceae bacterium]|nr:FAD-dependent monooxygenase [Stellaceae bacterium]
MARTPRVAIIGGGIGGLSAALALERRGIEVDIFEAAPSLGEIGAGLNLSPNALKVFRALDIEAEANAIGFESDFQIIRSWHSGRIISRTLRKGFKERFGAPHLTVHRADLLNVLSRNLRRSRVHLGARCIEVEPLAHGARARFADGSEIEADAVVGADGLHSVVRNSLFGADAPRFTGCICYRGLVPREEVPADIYTADGTMWMGPHGHVVHYWVRRGELLNIVAHYDSDAWTEESWTRECDRSELMQTYGRWHPSLLRLYECGEHWYKWALYDRDPLPRWSKGNATLLGDSAHAMLPYLGQGACMAIEDGYILAAAVANRPDDMPAALVEYETLRRPRANRAVLGSRMRAKENHLASPWRRLVRDTKFLLRDRFGTDKTAFQAAWLYAYDVAEEPIVRADDAHAAGTIAAK